MRTSAEDRARFIAGLRELADYLATHPDVPVPDYPHMIVHADGTDDEQRRAVDQAARGLGTKAAEPLPGGGQYQAASLFGPVSYEVLAITKACMDLHRARHSYVANITAAS